MKLKLKLKKDHNSILSTKASDVRRVTQFDRLISYIATGGAVMHRGHVVVLRQCSAGGYGYEIIGGNVTHPTGAWWINLTENEAR